VGLLLCLYPAGRRQTASYEGRKRRTAGEQDVARQECDTGERPEDSVGPCVDDVDSVSPGDAKQDRTATEQSDEDERVQPVADSGNDCGERQRTDCASRRPVQRVDRCRDCEDDAGSDDDGEDTVYGPPLLDGRRAAGGVGKEEPPESSQECSHGRQRQKVALDEGLGGEQLCGERPVPDSDTHDEDDVREAVVPPTVGNRSREIRVRREDEHHGDRHDQ